MRRAKTMVLSYKYSDGREGEARRFNEGDTPQKQPVRREEAAEHHKSPRTGFVLLLLVSMSVFYQFILAIVEVLRQT